ncbi:MAG: histidine kinase [Actinoplanes sp.]
MILEPHDAGAAARRRRLDEHWQRRRDLERQLHDGPALRIAALTLHLGVLSQKVRSGTGDVQDDIENLQAELHVVLQELRAIAGQIYPPLLLQAGLGAAVLELADSVQVPVRVVTVDGRFDPAVEGVAYFAVLTVLEGLRPATRTVDITVRRDVGALTLDLANVDTGHGIAVRDRIQWLGGAVEIDGGSVMGTIRVRIPCG